MIRDKMMFNFYTDEIEFIESKIREMAKKFIILLVESKFEQIKEFWNTNRFIRNSGQAYIQEMEIDESKKRYIHSIGYTNAVLDLMQLYLEKSSDVKGIDQVKTSYRDAVFEILAKRKILLHKDLAKELGVSPSGLNDIIKHMNTSDIQLVNVEEVSKYKLYSLTPVAYQYYMRNKEISIPPKPTKKAGAETIYSISNLKVIGMVDTQKMVLPNSDENEKYEGRSNIVEFKYWRKRKEAMSDFPIEYRLERMK